MKEIRGKIGILYGIAEAVAILDMVVGLTHAASIGGWVRPDFSTHLAILEGRHAILDLLTSTSSLVPNNTVSLQLGRKFENKNKAVKQEIKIPMLISI